jgi:hypothetical protein
VAHERLPNLPALKAAVLVKLALREVTRGTTSPVS